MSNVQCLTADSITPHRPQRMVKCLPYIKRPHAVQSSWSVPDLCHAYDWPTGLPGGGTIAIVELGGGYLWRDIKKYFHAIGQPVPIVTDVSVDGTNNSWQYPRSDADVEVALDIQVAGASYFVATGKRAHIRVYWATDIAPAVAAAAKDGCSVCSISWGTDEANWGPAALKDLEATAAAATAAGMTIWAASGDNNSSDGGPGAANVDSPASCPHVVACGGTSKPRIGPEVVWDSQPGVTNGEGTGGGYSRFFPPQLWQIGAPPGPGRLIPDIAANADPYIGYEIICYGNEEVVGGTSAVAPLLAGLFCAFGKKLGFVTRTLWANQACCNDVTIGDNGLYHAAVGPDACSGIGSPIASKIAKLLI